MSPNRALVKAEDLVKHFVTDLGQVVRAVDGVTFDILRGETLGLVGESGCGKTTLGRLLCRFHEPTHGRVIFDGVDLTGLGTWELRQLRPRIQMIFQDPFASLNPHKTIEQAIGLPLRIRGYGTRNAIRDRVIELMQLVGLDVIHAGRFPHQLSGGQQQRVGIARALAAQPDFIVADEPVSSLDVSIQAQILQILRRLQAQFRLTMLFVSHDISVVSHISHRIAVMYLGKIVEVGHVRSVLERPQHPYTQALLAAVPKIEPAPPSNHLRLSGDPPSPLNVPPGCRFHPRCFLELPDECRKVEPDLREIAPSHNAACHLAATKGADAHFPRKLQKGDKETM